MNFLGPGAARGVWVAAAALSLLPLNGACRDSGFRSDAELAKIRERAELGYPQQQIQLAAAYLTGRGVKQDAAMAARWYQKAAESGDPNAQNQIGYMYQAGIGVPVDMETAFHWYQLAVASGFVSAKVNLAVLYLNGLGVRKNPSMAKELLLDAINKRVGVAATYLGDMYLFGRGEPEDMNAAENWYKLGARLHDPLAAFNLAVLYSNAENHVRDFAKAADLLRAASSEGYVPAKHALGWLLMVHPELPQSAHEARKMLEEAAAAGRWQGSALLGVMARDGKIESANPLEAYYWFQVAGLQGGEVSRKAVTPDLNALEPKLPAEQKKALAAKADEWVRMHHLQVVFIVKDQDPRHDFPVIAPN